MDQKFVTNNRLIISREHFPGLILQRLNFGLKILQAKSRTISPYASAMPSAIQIALWTGLILLTIVLSLRGFHAIQLGMHPDGTRYQILAQSLIHSDEYGLINSPGDSGSTWYPFGYPLVLASVMVLFPNNGNAIKMISLVATVINSALLFWKWPWFSRRSYWWGLAVAGLYTVAPMTIQYSRAIFSDPVFLSFCLTAIILAQQAAWGRKKWWWSVGMSIVLVLVIFTRTIGLALMFTIFIYLFFIKGKKFWKDFVLIQIQMLIVVALLVGLTSVEPSDLIPFGYAQEIATQLDDNSLEEGLGASEIEHLFVSRPHWFVQQHLGHSLPQALLPFGGDTKEQAVAEMIGIPTPLGFLTAIVIFVGYLWWLKKEGITIFNLFLVSYLVILVFWVWTNPRFLFPIVPQLYLSLLFGMESFTHLGSSIFKPDQNSIVDFLPSGMLVAAVFILISISTYRGITKHIIDSRLNYGDLAERTVWLNAHSADSDIVMTEEPHLDFLYGRRKTIPYPTSLTSITDLKAYLVDQNVSYILIAPEFVYQSRFTPTYSYQSNNLLKLAPALVSKNQARLVYSREQNLVKIYEITRLE